MGRSLAILPALLFFAIAPPSWFRSFTASGPVRRRSTCTCADFCTTPARAVVPRCGRNPVRSVGAPPSGRGRRVEGRPTPHGDPPEATRPCRRRARDFCGGGGAGGGGGASPTRAAGRRPTRPL